MAWHLTNLPLDDYFIYASINDGTNPTVNSPYSTQTNFKPTGPISGYALDSINGDVGVPGIKMYLDDNGDGAFDPSTESSWKTNGEGYYRFDYQFADNTSPLQDGNSYEVGLVVVEGVALIASGNTNPRPITVASNNPFEEGTTFELQINTSIAGTVFQDANQNGSFDAGEKGALGWTVYVDLNNNLLPDVAEPLAASQSDGSYRIFDLSPNTNYTVRLYQDPDTQSNFFTTFPTSFTVTTGSDPHQLIGDKNFGVLEYATISGTVGNYYLQSNGNYLADTEAPPSNWEVQLLDQNDNLVATTTADTGSYTFENVIPGNYTLHQIVAEGWLEISPVSGDTPTFSHQRYTTGQTVPVAMVAADFDNDGDIDIATVAKKSGGGTVIFLKNDGTGHFTTAGTKAGVSFSKGDAFGLEVVLGLPNTTGPSLAVISTHGYVSLVANKTPKEGGLSFDITNNYAHFLRADDMKGVTAGDFDGDGITDLAGSYNASSGHDDRFSVISIKDAKQIDGKHFDIPGQLVAADMNNDGDLDLVLNSDDSAHKFNVAYGDGTGDFTTNVTTFCLNGGDPDSSCPGFSFTSNKGPAAIGDVNADGLLDILLGADGGTQSSDGFIYTQNSQGGFFLLQTLGIADGIGIVDLGIDRIQGEIIPNPVGLLDQPLLEVLEVGLFLNIYHRSDVKNPSALALIDVNSDGLPDMLAADTDSTDPGVWVYLNTTTRVVDISVTANPGQESGNLDFTNSQTAQAQVPSAVLETGGVIVTGAVYDDANYSGTRQAFENSLENIRIYLDSNQNGQFDNNEDSTLTNAHGVYAFSNLADGIYRIAVELEDGFLITSPAASIHQIEIKNGSIISGNKPAFDFGIPLGIHVARYTDSVDAGNDWTLRRNGAYLELIDNQNGGLLERHLLDQMHRVTLFMSNFTADVLTIDFQSGGAFSLPGRIVVHGGRDGLAGGSTLRFLGGDDDDVVQVTDTQTTINNDLVITWTDNLAGLIFETGEGNDLISVSGTPLAAGPIELIGGANDDTYEIATQNSNLRITDSAGVNTLDFSNATVGVQIDISQNEGQTQAIGAGNNTLALHGAITDLTGTLFDDHLIGNALHNQIRGLDGRDLISTGAGNNIVLGGTDDDQLVAGTGRNLLIGGAGIDGLVNSNPFRPGGGSVLFGGSTIYDDNVQALDGILAEWAANRPAWKRIANLTDGSGNKERLNDGYFLDAATRLDDDEEDILEGDSRMDWFLALPNDEVIDTRPGRAKK